MSTYKEKLQAIKTAVQNEPALEQKMVSSNMQLDYESFIYNDYIRQIEKLTTEIDGEFLPYYRIYLLNRKVDLIIVDISEDSINELIDTAKLIINALSDLNTTNNNYSKESILNDAYVAIYSSLLYENLFHKSNILTYIKYLDKPTLRENIGRILYKDLKMLNERELLNIDLDSLNLEGLEYDYLSQEVITKIASNTVGEKDSQYLERKRTAIDDLTREVNQNFNELQHQQSLLNIGKKERVRLYVNKSLLVTQMLSLIMIPIIGFTVGRVVGKGLSNKIIEYKTITRTINLETQEIIGEQEEVYDEELTTYVATVLVQEPWRKNPTGLGYIRDIVAYEYTAVDNDGKNNISVESLKENTREKYKYVESKDVLDNSNSMSETTIIVTETYQDKNDTQKSTKYIIPFAILGLSVAIAVDVLLIYFGLYDLHYFEKLVDNVNTQISNNKSAHDKREEKIKILRDNLTNLKDCYDDVVCKYGELEDKSIYKKLFEEGSSKEKQFILTRK